jgi:hypothetical protein
MKDGGSAFPLRQVDFGRGPEDPNNYGMAGMTLRDCFAMQAMVGLIGRAFELPKVTTVEQIVKDSYIFADAMLAEREKLPE